MVKIRTPMMCARVIPNYQVFQDRAGQQTIIQ